MARAPFLHLQRRAVTVAVLLFVVARAASALYTPSDRHVLQLTSASFASEVLDSAETVLVEFYAPWCGHCRNLAPEWSAAATKLHGFVKVAAIDCDAYPDIGQQYGVKGYPTIKVFKGVGRAQRAKGLVDYPGERNAKAITAYGKAQMVSYAARVKASGLEAYFSDEPALPHVLLFTDKTTTSPLFKALSAKFHRRVALGEITKREADKGGVAVKFKVLGYPTLLAFPVGIVDVDDASRLDGDMTPATIEEFIASYALPGDSASGDADPKPGAKKNPQDRKIAQPKAREAGINIVASSALFESDCTSRNDGLSCCLAFLPGGKASPLFTALEAVVEKYKFEKFAFSLVDSLTKGGGELAAALGFDKAAGGFGVMRGKKRRMGQIPNDTPLTEEALVSFLDKVLGGDARYTPLPDKLPEWSEMPADEEGGDGEEVSGEKESYDDSYYSDEEEECDECKADPAFDYDTDSEYYDGDDDQLKDDEGSCSADSSSGGDEGQCTGP